MICNQIWEFLNIPENPKTLPRTKCHIKVFCTYYYSFQVHYSFLLYFAARLNLYIFCSIVFGVYLTYSHMVHITAQIGRSELNSVHPTLKYTLGPLQWPKIHIKLGPVNCPKKKGPTSIISMTSIITSLPIIEARKRDVIDNLLHLTSQILHMLSCNFSSCLLALFGAYSFVISCIVLLYLWALL